MSTKLWQRVFSVLVLAGMLVTFVRPGNALANPQIDPLANPTSELAAAAGVAEVVYPLKADESPALRDIPPITSKSRETREIPAFSLPKAEKSTPDHQTVAPDKPYAPNMPSPLVNFEAIHNTYSVQPPDTQGDVGPNHYVQWVNLGFQIWDKAGNSLYGPANGNTLWSGFGGACETTNDGDPITLYDPLADRWLMSQFALPNYPNGPFYQCIAISTTADPTGTWYRYAYQMPVDKMNDYPKFGVWPDAYYMTVNQFAGGTGAWGGAGVAAFERQQMLLGNPAARLIYFDTGTVTLNYGGVLPADLDGPPNGLVPPANTPGLFLEWDDSTWLGDPADTLRVWEFHVDWATPANSTFGANANFDPNYMITTDNVDPDMCGGSRDCIPQPGTSQHLDAIADRLMYRLQYRNFGGYQTLVSNHTVDLGTDHAGVHWFELRNTGSGWGMFQQGVYGPDADHRWMASAALDHAGNLAVGYSVSSSTTYPSVRYAGRLVGDPAGTLAQGEAILATGTGSQTSFSNRWGDYSMMGVDPTDDCTFWYTQEYYQTNSSDWRTRVGSFKFPSCSIGSTGTLNGTVTNASNSNPIPGAQVTASSSLTQTFSTTTGGAGTYNMILPVETYDLTASAFGFVPMTVTSVDVLSGTVTTQNFALTPAVSSLVTGTVTDANTGWPLYASVTVEGTPLAPVWTDPETGFYSITLPNDSYTFDVEAFYPGYIPETAVVNVTGPTTQDFDLDVNASTCNAPGYDLTVSNLYSQDFETWPPSGWTVASNVAGGLVWNLDSSYGDANYTGGAGHAADVNSDANMDVPYDTVLRSPTFDLSAFAYPTLNYRLNYQEYGSDALDVDISTNFGATWTNLRHFTSDQGALYGTPGVLDSIDLSGYGAATNVWLRWRYYTPETTPWDYYAQVDEVRLVDLDCSPQDGGLVVGNVYDANTTLPLVGADVVSDEGASFATIATPADPILDDGFYYLFAATGTHEITATLGVYQPDVETVPVPHYDAIRQDFDLTAGWLSYVPDSFDVTLQMGFTATQQLTLTNAGGATASFALKELDKGVEPLGPFEQPNQVVKPFRQRFLSTEDLPGMPPLPEAAPLAAGDILQSWPTGLTFGWGLGYNQDAADVWIGDIGAGGGTDLAYRYLTDGTNTGDTIDISWAGVFAADFTYNRNTGTLWAMDVGGDDCIHEMDPVSQVPTGNTICPAWGTSQRGLAYDPSTDTYFAGSWNDLMIYHFASDGTLLQSVNVGLATAGLAYNPDTQHLFVMVNDDPNPVYVLDAANSFALVGQFSVTGFTSYGGAGFEMDCEGNLWAVDQNTQTTYQFESGEATSMCAQDVPWLSESPITGTLSSGSDQVVDISFDAGVPEITQPGIYHAQLKIVHDTPYVVANLPVTLTVTAPPTMGKLDGIVTGLGYCDLDPAPLEGAVVVIESSTGVSYTLETDAAGYYSRWLNVSDGPYIVSVTAPNHMYDMVSGVVITSLGTTTVGFELRLLEPCVSAAPPGLAVDVPLSTTLTEQLDIFNAGATDLNWIVKEMPGSVILAHESVKVPTGGSPLRLQLAPKLPSSIPLIPNDDIIQDGGFEGGTPSLVWDEYSTNFGTPICDEATCGTGGGTAGTHSGTYWSWFGGIAAYEEGWVSQDIVIPAGSATLSFYFWVGTTGSPAADYFDVRIDGDVVFHATGADNPTYPSYTLVAVDISDYADGASHTVEFYSECQGSGSTNFNLDDIVLDAVAGVDVPWLAESPITGTVAHDNSFPVDVTFTAFPTMTVGGVYTASLLIASNDPVNDEIRIPVTMTVVAPVYGVEVSGDQVGVGERGDVVTYTVTITNTSNFSTDSFTVTLGTHVYTTSLSTAVVGPLAMGESATFVVAVVIPESAMGGDHDTVQITVTSAGDPTKTAITNVTTNVFVPNFKIYLPLVVKNTAFTP